MNSFRIIKVSFFVIISLILGGCTPKKEWFFEVQNASKPCKFTVEKRYRSQALHLGVQGRIDGEGKIILCATSIEDSQNCHSSGSFNLSKGNVAFKDGTDFYEEIAHLNYVPNNVSNGTLKIKVTIL